jgi:hypothetical protein
VPATFKLLPTVKLYRFQATPDEAQRGWLISNMFGHFNEGVKEPVSAAEILTKPLAIVAAKKIRETYAVG